MKKPSKNISASLRSQNISANGPESISVESVGGGLSMTMPGTGKVEAAPGMQHERSAAKYADPMSRYGGK